MDPLARHARNILLLALLLMLSCAGALTTRALAADNPGSIGLQVVPLAGGELVVQKVLPGSPAEKAGIRPGDMIVQIGRTPLAGSDFAEVVARQLWGKEGSVVDIFYLRPGQPGRASVKLRRVAADPRLIISPAAGDPGQPGKEKP